jgi:hypothetical protein
MRAHLHALAAIALLSLAACADRTVRVADPDCHNAARAALAARGVGPSHVTSLTLSETRSTEAKVAVDRSVWVRADTCHGYMVVRVDNACNPIDLYATGDCALPGRT